MGLARRGALSGLSVHSGSSQGPGEGERSDNHGDKSECKYHGYDCPIGYGCSPMQLDTFPPVTRTRFALGSYLTSIQHRYVSKIGFQFEKLSVDQAKASRDSHKECCCVASV